MVTQIQQPQCIAQLAMKASGKLLLLCFVLSLSMRATGQKKFTINGYFSPAFTARNGNQISGIPSPKKSNYRNAAMLFSYATAEKLAVHVQFRHRLCASNPLSKLEKTIQFVWDFPGHALMDDLSTKFDRVLPASGNNNVIRDAGALLPSQY